MTAFSFAPLMLMLTTVAGATEVYKWIDEQGRTHYGDKPAAADARPLELDTRLPPINPEREQRRERRDKLLELYADERAAEQAENRRREQQQQQRQQRCERARKLLWDYEHSPYLYETLDNGERRILQDNERAARENRLRQFLQQECDPG